MIFALLIAALNRSSNHLVKRGIYQDLQAAFDFEDLLSVSNKAEYVDAMRTVAQSSKPYFHMSANYFDTGGRGMRQLWGDMEVFTGPKLSAEINFGAQEFSLTAWVRTVPQFLDGYILRKRPSPGSSLSCVGWYLHRNYGPALHYGAHDFDPRLSPFESSTQEQYEARTAKAIPFEPHTYVLMTMVVNKTSVQFFRDTELLDSLSLPRPDLTDCFNGGEGTLIGDPGLELGVVRYYPFSLTTLQIEEVRLTRSPILFSICRTSVRIA